MAKFRIEDYLAQDTLEANATATLPLVPLDGIVRYAGCHIDDEFLHFRKLTIQHLYALTIVHGPVPAGVDISLASTMNDATQTLEPCILAMADPKDLKAMDYLQLIAAGLDSWEEAGFEEPTETFDPSLSGGEGAMVEVATLQTMLDFAHRRFSGRIENLKGKTAGLSGRALSATEQLEARAIALRLAADGQRLKNLEASLRDNRLSRLIGV